MSVHRRVDNANGRAAAPAAAKMSPVAFEQASETTILSKRPNREANSGYDSVPSQFLTDRIAEIDAVERASGVG